LYCNNITNNKIGSDNMIEKPITAVWEITMGCNMHCKHCGSSCTKPLLDELTTDEALDLCDQIGELGFQWITLSGGEPTTRKDWHIIAKRLHENGVIPTMISNGWLIGDSLLDKAIEAGVNTIAISVDGLEETHDYIRKKGSFERITKAYQLMNKKGINSAAITTINAININQLNDLKTFLVENGVKKWQIQLGLPMGNMAENSELVSHPYHIDTVIDFICEASKDNSISIDPADCIGYYNKNLSNALKTTDSQGNEKNFVWGGCGAGKTSLGILHNGEILGCTSIRDRSFIEGGIRDTPLEEIWYNPNSFSWNRNFKKDMLKGICQKCRFGSTCLGGCSNTRIAMNNDLYSENKYCSYNLAVIKAKNILDKFTDTPTLLQKAKLYIENNNFQLAEIALEKIIIKEPENIEVLSLYGLSSFMLENYIDSKNANIKILVIDPNNAYAYKGLGLCLYKTGELEKGIEYLKKSIALADDTFTDPYFDLAVVLFENDRKQEALDIIMAGKEKSKDFEKKTEQLLAFYN
jgi:radical SAM protein with 4Fe4S-binding SPASM domain